MNHRGGLDPILGNYVPVANDDLEDANAGGGGWGSSRDATSNEPRFLSSPRGSPHGRSPRRDAREAHHHQRRVSEHRQNLLEEIQMQARLSPRQRDYKPRASFTKVGGPGIDDQEKEEEEEEDSHYRKLDSVLESNTVQMAVGLVIICNALVIGGETDYPDWDLWNYLEKAFLLFFIAELSAKVYIKGLFRFFCECDGDIAWNLFDFVVVALGVFDIVAETFSKSKDHGTATIFRLVRLLRILRVFRLFRMLKQLYLLAAGFAEAAQAVIWVTILMAFVLYTCSIILVRTLGHDPEADRFWIDKYGTIPTSMLTLFKLMSQPDLEPYHERLAHHPVLTMFLVMFIIFGSFGMIALLTGVISESMFDKNQTRLEEERLEREMKRELLAGECERLFEVLLDKAKEDNEDPDMEELPALNMEVTALPQITQLFKDLTVPYTSYDLRDVLDMMDIDGSGAVAKEEFLCAILSISDGIRPISFMELNCTVVQVKQKVESLTDRTKQLQGLLEAGDKRSKEWERAQNAHWEDFANTQKAMLQAIQELKTKFDSNHDETMNVSKSVDNVKERVAANQVEVQNVSRSLHGLDGQVQAVKVAVDSHAMNLMAGLHARESDSAKGMRLHVRSQPYMRDIGSETLPRTDDQRVMQETTLQDMPQSGRMTPKAAEDSFTRIPQAVGAASSSADSGTAHGETRTHSGDSTVLEEQILLRESSGDSSMAEQNGLTESADGPVFSSAIRTPAKGITMNNDGTSVCGGLPSDDVSPSADPSEALADMMRRFTERQHSLADEVASRVLDQLASSQALVLQASSGETPDRTVSRTGGTTPPVSPSRPS